MKLQLVATMVACLVVTSWAAAGEAGQAWNRHTGFYAEANLGTGLGYFGIVTPDAEAAASGLDGFGWVGAAGYSFTTHHAIEGGFGQWYTTFEDEEDYYDEDAGEWRERVDEVSTHLNAAYVAWRGTVPIRDRWALFGKAGAMLISVPDTETDDAWVVAPFTGLGLSYAVTPQIELSLQYQGAVYVVAGAGTLTLGATYHF